MKVAAALAHAESLLPAHPAAAARQSEAILGAVPDHPQALLLLGAARRRLGDLKAAQAVLEPLARTQPRAPRVHVEVGLTRAGLGDLVQAEAALRHALALQPALPDAWRALGDVRTLQGDEAGADAAYARHIETSVHDPRLMAAAHALGAHDIPVAERLLRAHLRENPTDVAALRMLAEAGTRLGKYRDAEALLARCLQLAPSFTAARHNLAIVLFRQHRAADAIPHLEQLHEADPADPALRNLLAACLAMVADTGRAVALYESVMPRYRDQPRIWLSFGHALRAAGRHDDAVAAYREALALAPTLGEAWWSLANLKTGVFTRADAATMRRHLAAPLDTESQLHFHYALGRAYEEEGNYAPSFTHYAEGARLRRTLLSYDAARTTAFTRRTIETCTPDLYATGNIASDAYPTPIFIVGLPRAGSTLIEQILASHPDVEGTMELPDIPALARETGPRDAYPAGLASLTANARADLGRRYLERTRLYRRQSKPFFIDKLPNNFQHIPLIQLILPDAKIIDARRHPMATCFSAFKQHFARGQHFSYDLTELGLYFRDYVALMDHFDRVFPGRIHRVPHETLVNDTEAEIRRLLAACGLAFHPACLAFHENARAVRTASSEQVRRPIFREGLEHWRNYDAWLGPLRTALGT